MKRLSAASPLLLFALPVAFLMLAACGSRKNESVARTGDQALVPTSQRLPLRSNEKRTLPDMIEEARTAVVEIKTSKGLGSGMLIREDGFIVTNSHVLQEDEIVRVNFFFDKESNESDYYSLAAIVENYPDADIAILKVLLPKLVFETYTNNPSLIPQGFPSLSWSTSERVRVGHSVIAIGSPSGLAQTVTRGIVSAINRKIGARFPSIQTDAPISPGSSGGPLLSEDGEVVGINRLLLEGVAGGSMAVPARFAKAIADQAMARYDLPVDLGMTIAWGEPDESKNAPRIRYPLTYEARVLLGENRLVISKVEPNSRAARAGLQVGDVLIAYRSVASNLPAIYEILFRSSSPEKDYEMEVYRPGSYFFERSAYKRIRIRIDR